MNKIKFFHDEAITKSENELAKSRASHAFKDQLISEFQFQKEIFEERIAFTDKSARERDIEVTEEAKLYAGRAILMARIKIAEQAEDPEFDRSNWNVALWKQTLAGFGKDSEVSRNEDKNEKAGSGRTRDDGNGTKG